MHGAPRSPALEAELVHAPAETPQKRDEPPVVARLVVEIRSDGSRTIARGALDDAMTGQTVAVEAHGDSPMQLAWALARSIFTLPAVGRKTVRALLPGGRLLGRRRGHDES